VTDGAEDEELPGVQNLLTSICIGEPAGGTEDDLVVDAPDSSKCQLW